MKTHEAPDIAASLVDLMFVLLGVSLLILAGFIVQSAKNSPKSIKFRLEVISFSQNYHHNDKCDQCNQSPFKDKVLPVLGCVIIKSKKQGVLYQSSNFGGASFLKGSCQVLEKTKTNTSVDIKLIPTNNLLNHRSIYTTMFISLDVEESNKNYIEVKVFPLTFSDKCKFLSSNIRSYSCIRGNNIKLPNGGNYNNFITGSYPHVISFYVQEKSSFSQKRSIAIVKNPAQGFYKLKFKFNKNGSFRLAQPLQEEGCLFNKKGEEKGKYCDKVLEETKTLIKHRLGL